MHGISRQPWFQGGKWVPFATGALCCAFLAIEVLYVLRLPLVMDEFDHASHVYRLTQVIPYRQDAPAKTLLGFYLLLPALAACANEWSAMLTMKLEIACLTTLGLWLAACRLRRHFTPPAIIAALAVLCTHSTFLERSSELRVDMLSALAGLASLLALLEQRSALAGAAAGCAVLMTQKGCYFVVALGGALAFEAVYCRSWALLLAGCRAGVAASVVVLGYVGFWCAVGDPANVWRGMLLGPSSVAFDDLYAIRRYWWQTLGRNPPFYLLALIGAVLLAPRRWREQDGARLRLWAYSLCLLGLCLWHKQPWPYFFVLLIPTLWVLAAAGLEPLLAAAERASRTSMIAGAIMAGALTQLVPRLPAVLARSGEHQRRVVAAISAYLRPGESYLAGTELAWRSPHVRSLRWLDLLGLRAAAQAEPGLLEQLRAHPPRLLVDNDRLRRLPPRLRDELARGYAGVGGNLRVYGPLMAPGEGRIELAFGGPYRLIAAEGAELRVDGGPWLRDGARVELGTGVHQTELHGAARLASWSDAPDFVRQTERPTEALFGAVYDY
ncbi:MAG TPA: hypothetical protein VFS67_21015 [Polyangiaceae bacterium]|nr:hypothetical protein [Polyangiaceae bacterium]